MTASVSRISSPNVANIDLRRSRRVHQNLSLGINTLDVVAGPRVLVPEPANDSQVGCP